MRCQAGLALEMCKYRVVESENATNLVSWTLRVLEFLKVSNNRITRH